MAKDYEALVLNEPEHRVQAAGVAARSLRDSPSAMAVSSDPFVRLDMQYSTYRRMISEAGEVAGVMRGDCVLGVATAVAPGACVAHMLPEEMRLSEPPAPELPDMHRYLYMGSVMATYDLPEEHWHVGPVGIEPGFQGRGLGHAAMEVLGGRLDDRGAIAWLETDKPENVRFYISLGYEVVSEAPFLGGSFWFMRRDPR